MRVPPGARRAAALLGVSATIAFSVSACGGKPRQAAAKGLTTTSSTVAPTTTTKAKTASAPKNVCPLTGAPPASGHVPQRAALAIKVENFPAARPQWGLNKADIVVEEPVEGAITRFIAIYQCYGASRVEPVRSGRFVDIDILRPLGKVLFGYAGAIQPVVNAIRAPGSPLEDVGPYKAYTAYWRDPARYAPHNLETSTHVLRVAAAKLGYPNKPPAPMFSYGKLPPGGRAVSAFSIKSPLDVTTWTWDKKVKLWMRSYSDTGLAMLGNNKQISATNVVVMKVVEYPTKWVEDATGAHENQLHLVGKGPAWIYRNGVQLSGSWVRPSLSVPASFVEADGTQITLQPGRTWEELVPQDSSLSTSFG